MDNTKENRVLVIGNGFDLYHGLKTRYIDFVESTKGKSGLKNNPFIKCFRLMADANDGWIDCEDTIRRIVELFDNILNERGAAKNLMFFTKGLSKESMEIIKIFNRYFISREVSYSSMMITDEFKNGFGEFDKKKFFDRLRKDLDDTIKALWHYLKFELNEIEYGKQSEQIANIKPSHVVNFNYMNTITQLYSIDRRSVFYIHGDLNNESENMVFGIPDDEEENLDFVYFKKYFQRIQKRTGVLDSNDIMCAHMEETGEYLPVHSYFFGHSLSTTDGDIIKQLSDMSDKITIYYLDQSDYEAKVINLLKIFGKKDGVKMIQDETIKFEQIQDPILC